MEKEKDLIEVEDVVEEAGVEVDGVGDIKAVVDVDDEWGVAEFEVGEIAILCDGGLL